MRVIMLTKIGGTRNGEEWPDKGYPIDLPDHEALDLIQARYARPEDPDAVKDAPAQPEPDVPAAGGDDGSTTGTGDDGAPEPGEPEGIDALDKPALIALAAKHDITVNPRWGETRMRDTIAAALEAADGDEDQVEA